MRARLPVPGRRETVDRSRRVGTFGPDTKQAWTDVGGRLDELGLKLKLHYEQTAGATEDDGELHRALEELREAVDHVFDAVGNAVRDPAVKEDARDVGRALVGAMQTTFTEAGDRIRKNAR